MRALLAAKPPGDEDACVTGQAKHPNRENAKQDGVFALLDGVAIAYWTAECLSVLSLHISQVACHKNAGQAKQGNPGGWISGIRLASLAGETGNSSQESQ